MVDVLRGNAVSKRTDHDAATCQNAAMTSSIAAKPLQGTAPVDSPTCPLCHTLASAVTNDALAAGARWQCTRCGQTWSATRLAAAAAYAKTR